MLKGIPQARRNNAWHKKNTKRMAHIRMSHLARVGERRSGVLARRIAEKQFKQAQERERNVKVGFFGRLKFFWLMAKIKTRSRMRKIKAAFSSPVSSTA